LRFRSRIGCVGYRTSEWDAVTMKERTTRSHVEPWGLAGDFAAWSVSSVPARGNTMEGNRIAWRVPDCPSGLRDLRAFRGEAGHTRRRSRGVYRLYSRGVDHLE